MNRRMSMMELPAWAELVSEWEEFKAIYSSVERIESADHFWRNKGFCEALNMMTNLENMTKNSLEPDDDL